MYLKARASYGALKFRFNFRQVTYFIYALYNNSK